MRSVHTEVEPPPARRARVHRPARRLRVSDVMSAPAVTVSRDAPFKSVAAMIGGRKFSSVPVVDDEGRLAGVVTEGDMLARVRHHSPALLAQLLHRSHSADGPATAESIMQAPIGTVSRFASLAVAARHLDDPRLRSLVVVDGERRPVGVVTRKDLLRVFLRADAEILGEVKDLLRRWSWEGRDRVTASVHEGVVTLRGRCFDPAEAELITDLVREIDGVVGVVSDGVTVEDRR